LDARDRIIGWLGPILDLLERFARVCVALCVVGVLCIVASQVVHRYFIRVPLAAPDEYAKLGMVWMAFIGYPIAYRRGEAVRIDIIDLYFPRLSGWLLLIFDIATLALAGLLLVKGWDLFMVGRGQQVLGTPFTAAWTYAAFVLGMSMVILFSLERLLIRRKPAAQT
jgi:TRAP-type C4-dicarboxylate transport system permease small subunit